MIESNNSSASKFLSAITPTLLLRLGLAFGFFYAGISSLVSPTDWIWYVPKFVESIVPTNLALIGFSIVEIILALWLVWGRHLKYSALISALVLGGITLISLSAFQITFRDVGLVFAALALFKLSEKQ